MPSVRVRTLLDLLRTPNLVNQERGGDGQKGPLFIKYLQLPLSHTWLQKVGFYLWSCLHFQQVAIYFTVIAISRQGLAEKYRLT